LNGQQFCRYYINNRGTCLAKIQANCMGIYDRDYSRQTFGGRGFSGMGLRMPPITPAVKWLLMINAAVFVLQMFADRIMLQWFSVYPASVFMALQPWRIITYQFLHGGFFHLFFNMLVLYFFGPLLEGIWGRRKFVTFYLVCGAMGGIVYPLLVLTGVIRDAAAMVGASGAIYGMLAAGAVLFPHVRVLFMFIVPMSLRTLAIVLAAVSILSFAGGHNAGGEAAHLAGMAAGLVYVLGWPRLEGRLQSQRKGSWARKAAREREFQTEVDRILGKVHESGISSLTMKEKKVLKEATQREQR